MTTTHAIQSIIEVALSIFFIWGVFNEPKLARAEKKLFARFRCRPKIKVVESYNTKKT